MKREQAQKLYDYCQSSDVDGNEYFVRYGGGPYVNDTESGSIEHTDDGRYVYNDGTYSDIDVEKESIYDFDVYLKLRDWTEGDMDDDED